MNSEIIKFSLIKRLSVFVIFIFFIFSLRPLFAENINDEQAAEYFKEALGAQKSSDLDKAITLYTKSLVFKPNSKKAHNNLGTIYAKKGDYNKAKEEYILAIKIDSHYTKALTNLAMIYLEKKDFEKFIEYWKRATGIDVYSTPFQIDEDKD